MQHAAHFVVERAFAGVSSHPIHGKLGVRAGNTGSVVLQDVRVPKANLLPNKSGLGAPLGCLDSARRMMASSAGASTPIRKA